MSETINSIGIDRIIESAGRLGKECDKSGREQIYRAAVAVIDECELGDEEWDRVIVRLKEALGI